MSANSDREARRKRFAEAQRLVGNYREADNEAIGLLLIRAALGDLGFEARRRLIRYACEVYGIDWKML